MSLPPHVFNSGLLASDGDDGPSSVDEELEKYGKNGYYPAAVGEIMMSRYVLLEKLAKGNFSTIWMARDVKNERMVIIKIKKNTKNYLETSFYEIEVFQKIKQQAKSLEWTEQAGGVDSKINSQPKNHIVRMLNSFIYESKFDLHFCIVFELLDTSLRTIMERYEDKGIPVRLVREMVRQMLVGVHFLHEHCNLIHNNLQPENMMFSFSNQMRSDIEKRGTLTNSEQNIRRTNAIKKIVKEINKVTEVSQRGKISVFPNKDLNNKNQTQINEKGIKWNRKIPENASFDSFEVLEVSNSQGDDEREETLQENPVGEYQLMTDEQFKIEFERIAKENNLTTKKELKNLKRKLKKKMKKYVYRVASFPKNDISLRILNGNQRTRKYTPRNVRTRKTDLQTAGLPPHFNLKIIDFANSCWVNRQFQNYYQTRNYKAPECILGISYTPATDIWAVGCIIYELLIGEKLFTPKVNKNFSVNEEHLAFMIELLGHFPVNFSLTGSHSKRYFNSKGFLKKSPVLNPLNLFDLLVRIHKVKEEEAELLSDFLGQMLSPSPFKRASAWQLLQHKWLQQTSECLFASPDEVVKNPKVYGWGDATQTYSHGVVNEEEFDADNSFSSSEIDDLNDDENDFYDSVESELKFFDKSFKNNYLYADHLENYKMDNTSCWQNDNH